MKELIRLKNADLGDVTVSFSGEFYLIHVELIGAFGKTETEIYGSYINMADAMMGMATLINDNCENGFYDGAWC